MSRGIKFCLVSGLICVILGGGIAGAAIAMGANRTMGFSLWDFTDRWEYEWGVSWDVTGPDRPDKPAISEAEDAYSKINRLDIDIATGNIVIRHGGEDRIEVWTDHEEYYRWSVKDNTLRVESQKKRIKHYNETHTLYIQVPDGWFFEEAELDMAAGNFRVDELQVRKLRIDMAAGNVEIKGGSIGEFALDVAAGKVLCQAVVQRDLDIDMAAGHVNVWMKGKESDYNYDITCALGNITIGDSSYSGLRQRKEINNDSEYELDINCSVGNVTINFEN